MKLLIMIIIICLPIVGFTQNKGDNTIVMKLSNISFKDLVRAIAVNGYEIDNANEDAGQITTRFKSPKGSNLPMTYRMKVLYDTDKIIAQGVAKMGVDLFGVGGSRDMEVPIEFKGGKNATSKVSFGEMIHTFKEIAKNTGGIVVSERR